MENKTEENKTLVANWEIVAHATGSDRYELIRELASDLAKLEKEYNGDYIKISIEPIMKPKDIEIKNK